MSGLDDPLCGAPGPVHRAVSTPGEPARWEVRLALTPCGCVPERTRLVCGPCLDNLLAIERSGEPVTCPRCGRVMPYPRQVLQVQSL